MDESLSPNPGSKENVSRYVCEECGESFYSLNEYIAHYKHLHPRSIGTAIT
jgi:transposase-like protein